MDSEIATLATKASTTVVALMATEGWQLARDGVVALWRRFRPEDAEIVGDELETSREELEADSGDGDTEAQLRIEWQGRIRRFLRSDPAAAAELRRLLDELQPELRESTSIGEVHLRAEARGHGRVYQAGRDQHITER
ncbi:hypothetical protein [Kitasatospora sp. HPMI-4]|uniref:hypothetical protein n=1 Tax=Kitasatospora sp. HPMI-4 TaxID=3448443 RepID=UPI003F1CEEDB